MGICGIYVRTSVETDGTSIEQQTELGIKFCNAQGFQYQVYEDVGKSGYKIDDENDPFKNRPAMAQLIDNIEKNVIDIVWVWEYSRLSRNQYAWYVLRKIFERNKIKIYEKDKLFTFDDPQSQMIQGILTQIAEYERHLITDRTTRGIRKTINSGIRSYHKTYGYKQTGKNGRFIIWKPVQSEIENIKLAYSNFLSGRPINSIVKELHQNETEPRMKVLLKVYRNILSRFDYTGFSLTIEGAELCNKYKNLEIDSLSFLNEQEDGKPKYYVPSINYPVQIVSIENWMVSVGKLIENKKVFRNYKRMANSDIFTGIINCPYCGLFYYAHTDARNTYHYYTHIPSKKCLQRPKSARREKINNLVEVFYFYYYLVYEDTNEFLKESRTLANLNTAKIKEKISSIQSESKKIEKQIDNFQSVYLDSPDKELLKLTLTKEAELKIKLDLNNKNVLQLKSELSQLDAEFKRDLKLLTYQNIKKLIISFFEKLNIEDKRTALIKIIKKCQLFGNYFLIDTGKLLFIFNVKEEYIVTDELYEQFKKGDHFKINFLVSSKSAENVSSNVKIVSNFLVRETGQVVYRYEIKKSGELIKRTFAEKNIKYDLTGIESIISFTEL